MSLFDSASVVITPSGYKEDKLYSIKPTDGSGDLVVTRATTATRVNSDGLIEVTPYNLLQRSEEFNNAAWDAGGAGKFTVTANDTIAPNGTLTADKLIAPLTNQTIKQNVANTNTAYNLSFYLKTNSGTKQMRLFINDSQLTSIVNVTSEWQLFTLSGTTGNTLFGSGRVGISNIDILDNSSFVYIWGAQLVSGSSAKEYFPTTDRLDVPRLDYTNSSCPSILVEPQRTNLLTYSEQFDNAVWNKQNCTITANTLNSPNGTNTADSLIASSGTATAKGLYLSESTSAPKSFSFFAKKGNKDWAVLLGYNGNNNVWFNISNGTIGTIGSNFINAKIENYGNGWYRCSATLNSSVAVFPNIGLYVSDSDNSLSCTGDGATASLYLWGAQLEAGSYATSYIPTVASSVTRNADVISKTGISGLIGQTEGTVFVDLNTTTTDKDIFLFSLDTVNNLILGIGSSNIRCSIRASSATYNFTNLLISGGDYKIAVVYKSGNSRLYVNGVLISTLSDSFSFSGILESIRINRSFFYGNNTSYYKQVQLYKTALTDQECINLTTL